MRCHKNPAEGRRCLAPAQHIKKSRSQCTGHMPGLWYTSGPKPGWGVLHPTRSSPVGHVKPPRRLTGSDFCCVCRSAAGWKSEHWGRGRITDRGAL